METTKLIGVSSEKKIINSFSTGKNINLRNCWLVEKGEFVVRLINIEMTKKLAIAIYGGEEKAIVSQYQVFKVIDPYLEKNYLMLIFRKQLTELQLLYSAFGGIYGGISWNNFINLPICVPAIEEQKRIVYKYQTVERLIKAKRKMNELLERWMNAYWHILFDNLEEQEYVHKTMGELFTISGGGARPSQIKN